MLALAAKGLLRGDLEDQLGVDRNSKSKNEDGYTMGSCLLRRVAVGVQPASTRGALQLVLETLRSGPTPPVACAAMNYRHCTEQHSAPLVIGLNPHRSLENDAQVWVLFSPQPS